MRTRWRAVRRGRRSVGTMTVHREAAIGFSRAAPAYERSRPGYPPAMVAWLKRRLQLRPGRTVIDLAAGTGKLTRELLDTGASVIAVEPVTAMLAQLVDVTGGRASGVAATAQALPVASGAVDAVTVAQAFHWFANQAALAEMTRVLRPSGAIALVWNRRDLNDPLQAALSGILDPYRGATPSLQDGRWRTVVDDSRLVAGDRFVVDHAPRADIDGLVERVMSTSFIAALDDAERAGVERRVRGLRSRFGLRPRLAYRCEGYLFTVGPACR